MTLLPGGPLKPDVQNASETKTCPDLTLPSRLADGFDVDVYDSVLRRSLLTAVERRHMDFIM